MLKRLNGRPAGDFFGRQDDAQRATRRMLVLFGLAVASVVGLLLGLISLIKAAFVSTFDPRHLDYSLWPHPLTLVIVGGVIAGLMGLVSWSRIRELGSGGWVVMRHAGAVEIDPDTTNPVHHRLYNIVQEMAIAASVPVPDVYLLENEKGINAFAAGHGPSDAAICITQGCLEKLTRDELQGVIAHEFSHIVHGDMRLNIRLIGLLAGIMFVASTGRSMMRGDLVGGWKEGQYPIGAFTGMIVLIIGSIGHLAGRLVQAAVSRSREHLADAAAVQFTRQQIGLVGALRKIQALVESSHLNSFDPNELAHMLFSEGGRWTRLMAAHPSVPVRIRALGLPYREQDIKYIGKAWQHPVVPGSGAQGAHVSLAGLAPATATAPSAPSAPHAPHAATPTHIPAHAPASAPTHSPALPGITPASVKASVGQHGDPAVAAASERIKALPDALRSAATHPEDAPAMVLALAVTSFSSLRTTQLGYIERELGEAMRTRVESLLDSTRRLPPTSRLPLLQMALPRLRRMPPPQRDALLRALHLLLHAEGHVDLHEFCLVRLIRLHLREAAQPGRARTAGTARLFDLRAYFATLCAILAERGDGDDHTARQAWQQAMDRVLPHHGLTYAAPPAWQTALNPLLERLDTLRPIDKELVVEGLATVVMANGRITLDESELLRLICACLHCPLPPFMQGSL